MALNCPRRIFRGSLFDVPAFGDKLRRLMLVGMAGAGIGAGAVLFGHASNLFGQAPAPPGAVTAEPLLVAVVDGATLRLHDMVVQLHGVVAPARGRSCPDGQGSFYDCGAAASAALANLVRDHRVACRLSGFDRAGLAQGVCEAGGREINRALVASGWARADDPALGDTEAAARAARRGLWRNGANPGF